MTLDNSIRALANHTNPESAKVQVYRIIEEVQAEGQLTKDQAKRRKAFVRRVLRSMKPKTAVHEDGPRAQCLDCGGKYPNQQITMLVIDGVTQHLCRNCSKERKAGGVYIPTPEDLRSQVSYPDRHELRRRK